MEASIYRMRLRDLLAVCVLSLLALGVLMVQSAAARLSGKLAWDFSPATRSGQVVPGSASDNPVEARPTGHAGRAEEHDLRGLAIVRSSLLGTQTTSTSDKGV
jgi:hypothetical protein